MQELLFVMGHQKREGAGDLFKQMEEAKVAFNMHIKQDRTLFNSSKGTAIPKHNQCSCFEFPSGGGVIMREFGETHTHPRTHARTHARTHTRTYAHTHTQTQTQHKHKTASVKGSSCRRRSSWRSMTSTA